MEYAISFLIGVISSIFATLIIRHVRTKYSSRLSFNGILDNIKILLKRMINDNFNPDYIITIDRNASIIGSIFAGFIATKSVLNIMTETIRLPDGTRKVKIIEETIPNDAVFNNKNILIITCFNDSGDTLKLVYEFISNILPSPNQIKTAALFTSISPVLKPSYYAKEVGTDIKAPMFILMKNMPWMLEGWRHVLANERKAVD